MSTLRIILLTTFVISANFLAGCSTVSEPVKENTVNSPTLTTEQRDELLVLLKKHKYNEELIQQWQQSQAGVSRLLAIESDLRVLIEQLNDLANEEQVIAKQSNNTVQKPEKPIAAAVQQTKMKVSESELRTNNEVKIGTMPLPGTFTIQLAAMSRLESIETSWQNVVNSQPNLVSDLTPVAEVVERANGVIYRLKAGRFDNKEDAILLCNKLRQANVSCVASVHAERAVYLPIK